MRIASNTIFAVYIFDISISFSLAWFYVIGSFSYFDLLLPVLLFILVLRNPKVDLGGDFILALLLILSLATGLSVLSSTINPALAGANPGYFARDLLFVGLYFLVRNWQIRPQFVILAIFSGLVFSVIFSLYIWTTAPRYFAFTSIPMMHVTESPLGMVVNRNQIGFASGLAFTIALYSYICKDIMWRPVSFFLGLCLLIFSILTFSKGAWLLVLIGGGSVIFLRFRIPKLIVFSLASSLFCIAIALVFPDLIESMLLRIEHSSHTNAYRVRYILDALRIGGEYPLFGIGPGNYGVFSAQSAFATTIDPHNAYLQTLAERGLVAMLTIFLIYTIGLITSLRARKKKEINILYFALVLCLAVDGFLSGLSLSSKYLYCVLALIGGSTAVRVGHLPRTQAVTHS